MKLSDHAKSKLEIYGIEGSEVIKVCRKPIYEFFDSEEDTYIKIVELEDIPFVVVFNKSTQIIITVYRTDHKTIKNRNKNQRWI